ncbi:hypothetical protein D3C71_1893520 [compost metagenome]
MHGRARELVHQPRRHRLAAGHGEDQAVAVGGDRLAAQAVDHAVEDAGAQVGNDVAAAELGKDLLYLAAVHWTLLLGIGAYCCRVQSQYPRHFARSSQLLDLEKIY